MKKIIVFVFVLVLSFTLCACGANQKNSTSSSSSSSLSSSRENSVSSSQTNSTSSSIESSLSSSSQSSVSIQQSSTSNSQSISSSSSQGSIEPEASLRILSSEGYLESASITFNKVIGAEGYNVYYKKTSENESQYKRIDSELIREYSGYMRADILGLSACNYDLRVATIANGQIDLSGAEKATVSVVSHSREGFAFSKSSPNGTASGAYNDDGTLKADAQILYVTKDNANTVTLDVIIGSNKSQVGVGIVGILALRQKGYDKTPLAIRFIGTIKAADITGLNDSGYLQVKGCYNVTVEGVGDDATCYGWSFLVREANNVEIRNFGIMRFLDDGVSIDTNNYNIWIHNNDFSMAHLEVLLTKQRVMALLM